MSTESTGSVYVKTGPVAVVPAAVTVTGPVVPLAGAITTSESGEPKSTAAESLLNLTIFSEAVGVKLAPLITTVVPAGPLDGLIEVMDTVSTSFTSGSFVQAE